MEIKNQYQKEAEGLKTIIEDLKDQMKQMKESILDVCSKAFGSSAQKNAVIEKLGAIKKGKNAEETDNIKNELKKEATKVMPKEVINAENEKAGKGKRK